VTDGHRFYFERTPEGSCPDPRATPIRICEGAHPNGCSRQFAYFTVAQAEAMEESIQVALSDLLGHQGEEVSR
jgi:hypothetical protein